MSVKLENSNQGRTAKDLSDYAIDLPKGAALGVNCLRQNDRLSGIVGAGAVIVGTRLTSPGGIIGTGAVISGEAIGN
jgi:hypothetical protein